MTDPGVLGQDRAIAIVTGDGVIDTAGAILPSPLVIAANLGGRAGGVAVRAEAQGSMLRSDSARVNESMTLVSSTPAGAFARTAVATTDASGHATIFVRFGTLAGDARVAVTIPDVGLSDTARFFVTAGAPVRYVTGVRDTIIAPGSVYAPRFGMADRYGNVGTRAVTVSAALVGATLDSSGVVHAGSSYGKGAIVYRTATTNDTARFTILDATRMAVVFEAAGLYGNVVGTIGLNGSNPRYLAKWESHSGEQPYPGISPAGDQLTFDMAPFTFIHRLWIMDSTGARHPFVDQTWFSASSGRFSGDGTYVFFAGLRDSGARESIWRMRSDGTGETSITAGRQPSPSPDGLRVAFVHSESYVAVTTLGGIVTRLAGSDGGTYPAFSPDAKRIAFLSKGRIVVVQVDGTNPLTVGTTTMAKPPGPNPPEAGGLAWSKDSRWILVRAQSGLILVSASGPEEVAVPNSASLYQPSLAQR
ncbi:hypothetical protein BH11GEM1_BH11GEM1_09160 [soil metagenome]